jgi:hypothetical protein
MPRPHGVCSWFADRGCTRLVDTVYWIGMQESPAGHIWNKLGTFLGLLKMSYSWVAKWCNVRIHRLKILYNNRNTPEFTVEDFPFQTVTNTDWCIDLGMPLTIYSYFLEHVSICIVQCVNVINLYLNH